MAVPKMDTGSLHNGPPEPPNRPRAAQNGSREKKRENYRQKETKRERPKEREKEKERERQKHRERKRERKHETERETKRETNRDGQTEGMTISFSITLPLPPSGCGIRVSKGGAESIPQRGCGTISMDLLKQTCTSLGRESNTSTITTPFAALLKNLLLGHGCILVCSFPMQIAGDIR